MRLYREIHSDKKDQYKSIGIATLILLNDLRNHSDILSHILGLAAGYVLFQDSYKPYRKRISQLILIALAFFVLI